jgi:hypothetical protein
MEAPMPTMEPTAVSATRVDGSSERERQHPDEHETEDLLHDLLLLDGVD